MPSAKSILWTITQQRAEDFEVALTEQNHCYGL